MQKYILPVCVLIGATVLVVLAFYVALNYHTP
jgi:hypothetical protein